MNPKHRVLLSSLGLLTLAAAWGVARVDDGRTPVGPSGAGREFDTGLDVTPRGMSPVGAAGETRSAVTVVERPVVTAARRARLDALLVTLDRAAALSMSDRLVLGQEFGLHVDDLGAAFPVEVALQIASYAAHAAPGVGGPLRACLERLGADPEFAAVVASRLDAADRETRRAALAILGAGRAGAQAGAIAAVFRREPDPGVRGAALAALGRIGDSDSVRVLADVLAGVAPGVRSTPDERHARRALAGLENAAGLDALAARWDVLPRAAQSATFEAAVRARPTPAVVARAVVALGADDVDLRCRAARVLGRSGDDAHVPVLAALLRDTSLAAERGAVLDALAALGTRDAAEAAMANLDGVSDEEHGRQLRRFCAILDRAPGPRRAW